MPKPARPKPAATPKKYRPFELLSSAIDPDAQGDNGAIVVTAPG
jgi:hypothetical protein